MERIPEINKEIKVCTLKDNSTPAYCKEVYEGQFAQLCGCETICTFRRTAMLKITFVDE